MNFSNFFCFFYFVQTVLAVRHFNKSCYKQIKGNVCFKMNSTYCLDGYLNYHYSANIFSNVSDVNAIESHLQQWKYLRSIPRCWRVMRQPLCTVFYPKCHFNISSGFSYVLLPSKELCNLRKDHCSLMKHIWPDYLQCDHPNFVEKCFKEMTYTVSHENSSTCPPSLKPSKDARQWYAGFEECSLPCLSVFFSKHQHYIIKIFTIIFGVVCLLANLFVMLTFMINWKHLNEFPDNVILYLNFCFCIATLAWLLPQFLSADNSITCNQDGTPISTEPYTRDSSWCLINFLCMHFCTLASFLWLLILTYTWQLSFEKSRREVRSRQVVFHLGVWSVSIVFTILTVTFTSITGDASKRICSVNHHDHLSRSFFIVLPPFIFTLLSLVFLIKGMLSLRRMKTRLVDQVLLEKRNKMKNSIVRIGVFSVFLAIFCVLSLSLHVHRILNDNSWQHSLRNYIICTSNIHHIVDHSRTNLSFKNSHWNTPDNNDNNNHNNQSKCYFESKPSLGLLVLEILNFFGTGVLFSSWLWRCAVIRTWKVFFIRLLISIKNLKYFRKNCEDNTTQSMNNNSKGNTDNRTSVVSTCSSIQTDLIGMNFDLSSMTSFDVSSLSSIFSSKTNQCSESEVSSARRFKRGFPRFLHTNRKGLKSRLQEQQMKHMGGVKTSSISSSDWSTGELSCDLSRGRSCDLQERLDMAFSKEEVRTKSKTGSDGGRLSSAVSDVVSNHKEECLIKSTDKSNLKNFLKNMNNTKIKTMDRNNRSSSFSINKNGFKSSIDGSISSRLQSSSFSSISQPLSSNSASLRNFVVSNTTDNVENRRVQSCKVGHTRSLSASMAAHKDQGYPEVEIPINDKHGSGEVKSNHDAQDYDGANDVDSDKEESLNSSNSNFTVASSDEDALSIQLDDKETTQNNWKPNEISMVSGNEKNDNEREFFNNFYNQKFYESLSKDYLQNYRQQQVLHHLFQQHSLYMQFLQQQEQHPLFQNNFPSIPESFPKYKEENRETVNNNSQPNNISTFNESFNNNPTYFSMCPPLTHSLPNQYSPLIHHSHPYAHLPYMHPFYSNCSFYSFNPPFQNITSTNFQNNSGNLHIDSNDNDKINNTNNMVLINESNKEFNTLHNETFNIDSIKTNNEQDIAFNIKNDVSNKEVITHNHNSITHSNDAMLSVESQKEQKTDEKGIQEDDITKDELTKFKLLNRVEVFSDESDDADEKEEDDDHDENDAAESDEDEEKVDGDEDDEISNDDEIMHSSSSAMSIIDEDNKSFIESQFDGEGAKDKSFVISINSLNNENLPASDITTNIVGNPDDIQKARYSSVEARRKKKRHERYKRLVAVQNKKKNLE